MVGEAGTVVQLAVVVLVMGAVSAFQTPPAVVVSWPAV
jgi:hypothetical protein